MERKRLGSGTQVMIVVKKFQVVAQVERWSRLPELWCLHLLQCHLQSSVKS